MKEIVIFGLLFGLILLISTTEEAVGLTEEEENELAENVQALENEIANVRALENGLESEIADLTKNVQTFGNEIVDVRALLDDLEASLESLTARFEAGEIGPAILVKAWVGEKAVDLGGSKVSPGMFWIAVTDEGGNPVPEAELTLIPPVFGALMGYTLPVSKGIVQVNLTELGGWKGKATAPYHKTNEFAFEVEHPPRPESEPRISFMVDGKLKIGEPNVIRALRDGGLVAGTIRVDDPDADPEYRVQQGPNPLSFVVGSESFAASVMENNERLGTRTFSAAVPKGGSSYAVYLVAVLFILLLLLAWRRGWLRRHILLRRRIEFPR